MPTTKNHSAHIKVSPNLRFFIDCSCGYISHAYENSDLAYEDWQNHVAADDTVFGQTQGEYLAEKEAKKKAEREEQEAADRKAEEIVARFGKKNNRI